MWKSYKNINNEPHQQLEKALLIKIGVEIQLSESLDNKKTLVERMWQCHVIIGAFSEILCQSSSIE